MSIEFVDGDIFESGCEALVNPVNIDPGYMGALAGLFSRRFPGLEQDYLEACRSGKAKMGQMVTWHNLRRDEEKQPRFIINFPTVVHPGGKSDMSYITSGLEGLVELVKNNEIKSIAIPALGAGVGGLSWDLVKAAIEDWHSRCPNVDVKAYNPR